MASTSLPELALLEDLVAIPSVSGTEETIAPVDRGAGPGLGARRTPGRRLGHRQHLGRGTRTHPRFVSHLDTVPAGDGWTREPFIPTDRETTCLYGRGSGDAKASVAAMLSAARDAADESGSGADACLVILGYGEETRHTTMRHRGRAGRAHRRRRDRRADQPRLRCRAARTHDGGPGGPRSASVTPATRRMTVSLPTRWLHSARIS